MSDLPDTHSRTWVGTSGLPYPFRVHQIAEYAFFGDDLGPALAIARSKSGFAKIVSVVLHPSQDWLGQARSAGATEIHLHEPDAVSGDPRAIVDDLRGSV